MPETRVVFYQDEKGEVPVVEETENGDDE